MSSLDELISDIARRHLRIDTLETRKSDSLDFHDISVWSVRTALFVAYDAGYKAGYEAARKNNNVVIEVFGGVAHVSACPADIKVKIIDHDLKAGEP